MTLKQVAEKLMKQMRENPEDAWRLKNTLFHITCEMSNDPNKNSRRLRALKLIHEYCPRNMQ